MTGIIIQARKGSTRLPNKMMLPFYNNKGVLELLFEKLIVSFDPNKIILATTTNADDNELVEIANKYQIKSFRGDETNVLSRFIDAADFYGYSNIIRICADNPFLDIPHIHDLIKIIKQGNFEYVSYKTDNGFPTIKSHLGLYTEAVTLEALKKIATRTKEILYLEHVTNYIYMNESSFNICLINLPFYMAKTELVRLTLDTIEDFKFEKNLYEEYKQLTTKNLIEHILRDKRRLNIMLKQIQLNTK